MKKKIENLIVASGIDLKYVVVGTGETYCKSKGRFVFQAGKRKEIKNRTAKITTLLLKHKLIVKAEVVHISFLRLLNLHAIPKAIQLICVNAVIPTMVIRKPQQVTIT